MPFQISILTRRFATLVVAALVLFAAVAPASAAVCCQTRSMMSLMHGTMPCCNHCKITSAQPSSERDPATVSAPAPVAPMMAVIATVDSQTLPATADIHDSATGVSYSPPPQFLLNEQFRI